MTNTDDQMIDYPTRLRAALSNDLRTSMKARDTIAVSALRALLAALDNANAVPMVTTDAPIVGRVGDVKRKNLSEVDCAEVFRREAAALREAVLAYDRFGRPEEAARTRRELEVVERYVGQSHQQL